MRLNPPFFSEVWMSRSLEFVILFLPTEMSRYP